MGELIKCPNCGRSLEKGHLGFYTGLWWHDRRLAGMARAFPYALTQGERLAGHWTSPGVVRMIDALRCEDCDTVVLTSAASSDENA